MLLQKEGTDLTLGYANDGESGYNDLSAQSLGPEYATKEFIIPSNDRDCESMSFAYFRRSCNY